MIKLKYDPVADAVYIYLGKGAVDETREDGPFVYDVDSQGRILGIEILRASHVIAPGSWISPETRKSREDRSDQA